MFHSARTQDWTMSDPSFPSDIALQVNKSGKGFTATEEEITADYA